MFYEYISLIFGIIKLQFYKILYFRRVIFKSFPKMNGNFRIAIKKKSKLILGSNFRCRNNMSFRIYNEGYVEIGDNCFFNDGCSINCQKNVRIGNNVICGQNVMIFDHDHDYKKNINDFICEEIIIGNNVWIGANVTILKGVSIGDDCVIAAGTVVRKNIKNNSFVHEKKDVSIKEV